VLSMLLLQLLGGIVTTITFTLMMQCSQTAVFDLQVIQNIYIFIYHAVYNCCLVMGVFHFEASVQGWLCADASKM